MRKSMLATVSDITALGPRQGKGVLHAAAYLRRALRGAGIRFAEERHSVKLPKIGSAALIADGVKIPCAGCSFVGGRIETNQAIVSSLIPSRFLIGETNINFNPACRGISRSNFYFAPAVAVDRVNVLRIARARRIRGIVTVSPQTVNVPTLLVGNSRNPDSVVFAHYDAIGTGATDNASGVATILHTIQTAPETLATTLYVFDGNEELSYDRPTYWGHGFRVFEHRHKRIMERARLLLVVDCVGNGRTVVSADPALLRLAFPIRNSSRWARKTATMHGDIGRLMAVYHSDNDTAAELNEQHLDAARKKVISLVRGRR